MAAELHKIVQVRYSYNIYVRTSISFSISDSRTVSIRSYRATSHQLLRRSKSEHSRVYTYPSCTRKQTCCAYGAEHQPAITSALSRDVVSISNVSVSRQSRDVFFRTSRSRLVSSLDVNVSVSSRGLDRDFVSVSNVSRRSQDDFLERLGLVSSRGISVSVSSCNVSFTSLALTSCNGRAMGLSTITERFRLLKIILYRS
jgi:hypothetical protein